VARLSADDTVGARSPGRLLRQINKRLERRIEGRFADSELSFEEWMALKLLEDGIVETTGDLARDLNLTAGGTTRLVDHLEQQGLVERERTAVDRRVVLLRLTPAGKKRYREKLPVMLESWNDLLRDFDQAEFEQLVTLLTKLLGAF
jgi:DNA-binding MarR family transcriptional regulator